MAIGTEEHVVTCCLDAVGPEDVPILVLEAYLRIVQALRRAETANLRLDREAEAVEEALNTLRAARKVAGVPKEE